MDVEALNLGFHACVSSTLEAESFTQPQISKTFSVSIVPVFLKMCIDFRDDNYDI